MIDDFVAGYRAGQTPNPCVRCNEKLKFGPLLAFADAVGATALATGHYARLAAADDGGVVLGRARDRGKDQSYFLFGVRPELLSRVWFPLGDMSKDDVRRAGAAGRAAQRRQARLPADLLHPRRRSRRVRRRARWRRRAGRDRRRHDGRRHRPSRRHARVHDRPAPRCPRWRGRAAVRVADRRRDGRGSRRPARSSRPRSPARRRRALAGPASARAGRCDARCRSATTPSPRPPGSNPNRMAPRWSASTNPPSASRPARPPSSTTATTASSAAAGSSSALRSASAPRFASASVPFRRPSRSFESPSEGLSGRRAPSSIGPRRWYSTASGATEPSLSRSATRGTPTCWLLSRAERSVARIANGSERSPKLTRRMESGHGAASRILDDRAGDQLGRDGEQWIVEAATDRASTSRSLAPGRTIDIARALTRGADATGKTMTRSHAREG